MSQNPSYEFRKEYIDMRRTFSLLSIVLFAGCVEPYPAWERCKVEPSQVPDKVLAIYMKHTSNACLIEIEQSTLGSRFQGFPKQWCFKYKDQSGQIQTIVFDEKGSVIENGNWFTQ